MSNLKNTIIKHKLVSLVIAAAVLILPSAQIVTAATSGQLQAQINQLNAENNGTQSSVNDLQLQASSYQDAINKLQAQIDAVRADISASQARQADIQQQIAANLTLLALKKATLGEDIKAMYVDGTPSTIEILATSNNLSDYFDKQEYRTQVQAKLQDTLKQIAILQQQLQAQKIEVDNLLIAQKQQQAVVDAAQAEQSRLLSLNQQQQDVYNQKIATNQGTIAELQRQQAALNTRGSQRVFITGSERGGDCDNGSGNGGYFRASGGAGDVCNAGKDSITDMHGIENRECTSYAYWYFVNVEGNFDFSAKGDANNWANSSNYGWSYTPNVGSIGVIESGTWGHVTIIQATAGQSYKGQFVPPGQVLVSEMNYDFGGHFRYSLRDTASMKYINNRH